MPKTRTTVILDDDLLRQAKVISKTGSATGAITYALQQMVRRDALNRLAAILGTSDEPMVDPTPRRRPPTFTNDDAAK